ncbi:signal peptidase I [Candidatus Rariloculus sp.]|uniref:signal peptidase I n=1 Tax=Candidatus Rariloculus sp. TaxID=3101265 RepID=UPI003D0FE9C8
MDFALILVVGTFATGLIWLFDSLVLKRSRRIAASRGDKATEPAIVEYSKSFFPILLIVLVLRSFLFEPFRIPSGSMMPTLLDGDFIFVNKFAYGLRLPVLNSKIVELGAPERGDVVVFRLPSDPSINYIKRVVGLPGDTVVYEASSKRLTINDEQIPVEPLGTFDGDPGIDLVREDLGGRDHGILLRRGAISPGGTYQVPEGHYFVMGDNRDNSQDSRFRGVEFVPDNNLVGRAMRVWMSWRSLSEGGPRWSRIGTSIE